MASVTSRFEKKELEELYWNANMSCEEIARQKKVCPRTIRKAFNRLKIKRRTLSEVHKLRVRQKGYSKPPTMRGALHPGWKGGRRQLKSGYVLIHFPSHPRAQNGSHGYVFEHILVWEKSHGCYLPKDQQIHHLNGIRNDNRPENLVAVSRYKHEPFTFMRLLQKRIQDLELQLSRADLIMKERQKHGL